MAAAKAAAKKDKRADAASKLVADGVQKWGPKFVYVGGTTERPEPISTGSRMWDFIMGTGGWLTRRSQECFGAPSIGKTSLAGFNYLGNIHKSGGITATIAVEPDWDDEWAAVNGVNPDYNVVWFPDHAEEALEILRELVFTNAVDGILFDSVGAMIPESDLQEDSTGRVGGISKLLSTGVGRIQPRLRKTGASVLFINQQRADMQARIAGLVDSPGGWAFKHHMKIRVHLKPGAGKYNVKRPSGDPTKGNDDVMAGREIVATFKKAKAHGALNRSARFDWYHMQTDEHPFGVDVAKDIIATALVAGVFEKNGNYIKHDVLPGGQLLGKMKVGEFLLDPDHSDQLAQVDKELTVEMEKRVAFNLDKERNA